MAGLSLRGIEKAYGDVTALRGLDLEVGQDELMVIVGPSGCGKSTALRVISGLERADAGTVAIGGLDMRDVPPGRRNVAMVFQEHAVFPHMSVAENIGFGMRARGATAAEVKDAVMAASALVGCGDLLDRRPHELSGGERQRVALARALVRRPDVFLLDEPLSNLDVRLRDDLREELRALHQRVGGTMVHVTHDQIEALTLGDRVAVLADGAIHQVGTPDELYRHPANRLVATFIGRPAMNLLPVEAVDGELRSDVVTVPMSGDVALVDARMVEIGVRPEDLRLEGDGTATRGLTTMRGVVSSVERAAADTYVHVDLGGSTVVVRTSADQRPSPAENVTIVVDHARVHVFDETGRTVG